MPVFVGVNKMIEKIHFKLKLTTQERDKVRELAKNHGITEDKLLSSLLVYGLKQLLTEEIKTDIDTGS